MKLTHRRLFGMRGFSFNLFAHERKMIDTTKATRKGGLLVCYAKFNNHMPWCTYCHDTVKCLLLEEKGLKWLNLATFNATACCHNMKCYFPTVLMKLKYWWIQGIQTFTELFVMKCYCITSFYSCNEHNASKVYSSITSPL